MITKEQINLIVKGINENASRHKSAAKQAVYLGISQSQLSRVKKGQTEQILSNAKWINIARKLEVELGKRVQIKPAKTPVFKYIETQLQNCQQNSVSGLLCDAADIGKTFAAKHYAKTNNNVVYVDCSQSKSKQKLVRTISQELGIESTGRYQDVYEDLVFYIKSLPKALIILDEAGDLSYGAFLELKALWNATEYACGWYMMGADGLKAKIEGNIGRKKVGYTEIFSRYGNKYQRITPEGDNETRKFAQKQTAAIAKANGITDVQNLYARTQGSLRRIHIEIGKLKTSA